MSMAEAPLVYVVEDDAAMLDALLLLLRGSGFSVLGFASAEEFLAQVDSSRTYCLLTDVRLPGMDGITLHRHLRSIASGSIVVMLTGHGDVPMAVAALKDGVADFVEKPFDPAVLLGILWDASQRADAAHQRRTAAAETNRRLQTLTPREAEILALLVEGHPNKVIAARLGIGTRTTEHHRAHIMEKTRARSLSQLIRMALAIGD
jgi:two-component system, LuxR family, response regulator FixJ